VNLPQPWNVLRDPGHDTALAEARTTSRRVGTPAGTNDRVLGGVALSVRDSFTDLNSSANHRVDYRRAIFEIICECLRQGSALAGTGGLEDLYPFIDPGYRVIYSPNTILVVRAGRLLVSATYFVIVSSSVACVLPRIRAGRSAQHHRCAVNVIPLFAVPS